MNPVAQSAAKSDVGRSRKLNEDSFYVGKWIFAVADGLGGHRAGEVASKLAVEALAKLDGPELNDPARALVDAIVGANEAIHQQATRDSETHGMATTVTSLALKDSKAYLAHVGDSRCYLLRAGELEQVSSDHTLVAHMIQEGTLTPAQAESHPQRSIVTRALGADESVSVDVREIPLQGNDRILVCSDGLSSVVPEDLIQGILAEGGDLDSACESLINEANIRGGPDNITVVLIDIDPSIAADGSPLTARTSTIAQPAPRATDNASVERSSKVRTGHSPIRAIVWVLLILLLTFGALGGVRAWANRSWYVGLDGNNVAIFRGLPTQFLVSLHHVQERTPITTSQLAPYYVDRLRVGIRANSLSEARQLVQQAPRSVSQPPAQSSGPAPAPSASPTGSHS